MASDTIFALASGRPPAAISIIRLSGPQAHAAAERLLTGKLPPARFASVRKIVHPDSGETVDDGLVLRFDGPASSTGEDLVEFHCHGGRAVSDALQEALARLDGVRRAEPGEFTRRAFENGRIDLTEAEGLADLVQAETEAQRRQALMLAEGGLRRQIDAWQDQLVGLSAQAEAAIDYVGEDGVDAAPDLSSDCEALASELGAWLDRPRAEPLKDGVRIVVAGPPNAGKSSLINALSGQDRAIVTDIPGTTRDHIEVPLALGGLPVVLTDTAGLRDSDELVERIGVERARSIVEGAHILLWMGAPQDAPHHPRLIQLHPRADLADRRFPPDGALAISSVTGAGLDQLLKRLIEEVRQILPSEGDLALNRRQAACLSEARGYLLSAAASTDLLLAAEELRAARGAFDRLTGRAGVEDVLDALFGRFCLGK